MEKDKFILDVCCGCKQFWFDKNNPNVLYNDFRTENKGFQDARPNKEIKPDTNYDFTNLPFPDRSFKLVVMDPPHIFAEGPAFRMVKEYGWLNKHTWRKDIKQGFDESMRVLEDYGILIFKWNEVSVKRKDLLEVLKIQPLIGHQTLSKTKTHWFCFMKIPK